MKISSVDLGARELLANARDMQATCLCTLLPIHISKEGSYSNKFNDYFILFPDEHSGKVLVQHPLMSFHIQHTIDEKFVYNS